MPCFNVWILYSTMNHETYILCVNCFSYFDTDLFWSHQFFFSTSIHQKSSGFVFIHLMLIIVIIVTEYTLFLQSKSIAFRDFWFVNQCLISSLSYFPMDSFSPHTFLFPYSCSLLIKFLVKPTYSKRYCIENMDLRNSQCGHQLNRNVFVHCKVLLFLH